MEASKKKIEEEKAACPTGNTAKIYWRCAARGCNANKSVRRHAFPKDPALSKKWVEQLQNPDLANLTPEDLRSHRVCLLHFHEDSYSNTSVRQVLKKDAFPELLLNLPSSTNDATRDFQLNKTSGDMGKAEQEMTTGDQINTEETLNKSLPLNEDTNVPYSTPTTSGKMPLGKITRKQKLTPVASRLHGIASDLLKRQRKQQQKLQTAEERLANAEAFINSRQMRTLLSLPKQQLAFLEMQIRNIHIKVNARTFSLDEKVLALAILKQSAQCYRLLSRIFILPTPRTLHTFLHRISLKPGVNDIIMTHLENQGKNMPDVDKVCVLAWNELTIDTHLHYDEGLDQILGFEDWGNARSNRFADHALVFILRGIRRNWMIPISYNFCKSSTSAAQLVRCIKEIVRSVTNAGFNIAATVCDQGTTNVSCVNTLLSDSKIKCFNEKRHFKGEMELCGQNVIPLYDPPHLINGIRNDLLNKNLEVRFRDAKKIDCSEEVKKFLITSDVAEFIKIKLQLTGGQESMETEKYIASWDILELAYDIDTKTAHTIKRRMPKLHDGHIRKHKIPKMRVKLAAQTLSRTTAGFIRFLTSITGEIMTVDGPKSMPINGGTTTSAVLQFFNDVFDSVNGSKHLTKEQKNSLRREVTRKTLHSTFWKEAAISMKKDLRFIDPLHQVPKSVPSLKNWISTLQGFQQLWTKLQEKGFKTFSPRFVNQDALENFFGMIRSDGRKNINPTCKQFQSSYKTLLVNNLTYAKTVKSNCEDDGSEALCSLRDIALLAHNSVNAESIRISLSRITESESQNIDEGEHRYLLFQDVEASRTGTSTNNQRTLTNLLNKIKSRRCCDCVNSICNFQHFNDLFNKAHSSLEGNIPFFCFKNNIAKNLKMPLLLILDFSFITCTVHNEILKGELLTAIVSNYIRCWCRFMTRLLKGKDSGTAAEAYLSRQTILQHKKSLHRTNR